MTIPANTQQAAQPWGAEAVYLCYGPQGGPFTIVDTGTPLPVSATVNIPNPLPVSQSGSWTMAATQSGTWTVTQSGTWTVGISTGQSVGITGTATVSIAGTPSVSISGTPSFTPATATSGGCTPYSYIAAGSANQDSQSVKGSAGQLYGYQLFNTTSSDRYVKIYDKASAPTSADTPKLRLYVPSKGGANLSLAQGIAFANGIGIRITTGPGDSDTGACSTNDVLVNLDYA